MTDASKEQPPSEQKSNLWIQYGAAIAVSMNAYSQGCSTGWYSPATIIFKQNPETNFSYEEMTWIASIFLLSTGVSMLTLWWIILKIGTRTTLIVVAPFQVGSWLFLLSDNLGMILAGRALLGVCGGLGCVAAPLFIGEMSEPKIRGRLGILYQLGLCAGVLTTYLLGITENKYCLLSGGIIVSLVPFSLICMPETPLYYLKRKRLEEAKKSLQFYRGKHYDVDEDLRKMDEYLKTIDNSEPVCTVAFQKPSIYAMIIVMAAHILQQCSGIKGILSYCNPIFREVIVEDKNGHISSSVIGVTLTATTFVSAYLVEKCGRKMLMIISYSCMTLCHVVLAVFFFIKKEHGVPQAANYIPLVFCCLYILTYSLGAGPVCWALQAEMFPPKIKYLVGSIAGCTNWLTAFWMLMVFPYMNTYLGMEWTFLMFSIIAAVGILVSVFLIKETKGKSLEEIQDMLAKKKG